VPPKTASAASARKVETSLLKRMWQALRRALG